MNRGDIHWVDLGDEVAKVGSEIYKCRPSVILSSSVTNRVRKTIVVAPFSSSAIDSPPISVLTSSLKEGGGIICDQIRAVDKSRVKQKICKISDKDMKSLEESLRMILCL